MKSYRFTQFLTLSLWALVTFCFVGVPNVQAEQIVYFPLDTDPGWTVEGQWQFGMPLGLGGTSHGYPDPDSGATGVNVYGVNIAGDYSTTIGGPYYLTIGPLDLSGYENIMLQFKRWLNTDYQSYVFATVEVSNNGTTWVEVWNNGGMGDITDNEWMLLEYDISSVADKSSTVYLRWGYQIGSGAWAYSGWNIDDISLSGTPLDNLTVTPTGLSSSSGYEGGPFKPLAKDYTLINTGPNSLDWTAADVNTVSWLDVEPNSGTLDPNQSIVVSVSINANADVLDAGNYDTAIIFTNLTSGINRVRPVSLIVKQIPPDGWASENGGTTGGADGNVVTVTTAADLAAYAETVDTPYIIQVSGVIDLASIGGKLQIQANKTIRGIGINPTIIGNVVSKQNEAYNIIIERLNITNPSGYGEGDGITIKYSNNIFITKCTFYDCGTNGLIDITRQSDWVTVSWCKFYCTTDVENWGIIKVSGDDENTDDRGTLHITFHHNWWSTLPYKGGMPRVYFGRVHVYNNYYNCPDSLSSYIGAGRESQVLIENNYFEDVNYPYYTWYYDDDPGTMGEIGASGNIFDNCIWWDDGNDDVFEPNYPYTLDNAADVPAIVMAGAGAPFCYGDFDRSESVDFNDLALFVEYWLVEANYFGEVDYDDDGIVNFLDFAMLAANWGRNDFTAPLAPTGLTATIGNAKVLLDWNNSTEPDLAGYNIYRSITSVGGYTKVNTLLQTSSDYNDTSVVNETTYYYVVTAVDTSSNESGYSSQVLATPSATIPPAAPKGLFATSGNAKVLLYWNSNAEGNLEGYNIYRSETSGTGFTKINTSLQITSDYNDTSVTNGTTYYYVVTALNTAANESKCSNQASATPSATPTAPQNLMVPPMAYDDTQIILIWSKPVDYSGVTDYNVYQDGTALGLSGRFDTTRAKLYYIVTGLTANTSYDFTVKSVLSGGGESEASNTCSVTTANTPAVFYPEDYGAAANGTTKDTDAIQDAIDACPAGGKVHLRAGKTFLSGAIFVKSNMTLQIDGTLLGSDSPADYPYTSLRFPYYASGNNYMGLVNAYYDYTNPDSAGKPYGTITNVRICGSGVINGCYGYDASDPHTVTNLTTLGDAEVVLHGDTSRGDLVTVKGINQVYVGGWGGPLTLVYPAEHTIFISYCNDVTVSDVNCDTWDIHNGDGINLCTSDTAYIFNSKFDTGDDCINMNAGQGQPGVDEDVPVQNVRVFDCTTERGHGGYVIGSFTAAWVQDSLIEDCHFSTTDGIGIRMKTGYNNGGGGRRITCRDITITGVANEGIFLDTHYSATGYPNAGPGQFSGNIFKNINVNANGDSIFIYGWLGTPHTQNIFENVTGNNRAYLRFCTDSTFIDVNVPSWTVDANNCSGNISSGCPGCPFIPFSTGVVIQEYESGFCGVNGTIATTYTGYTGSGYCMALIAAGNGIDWSISVPSDGTYTFKWRYSLRSGTRTPRLLVNDSEVVPSISFPITDSWSNWDIVSQEVSLTAGVNNIRLESTGTGIPYIDYILITGDNPSPASCP